MNPQDLTVLVVDDDPGALAAICATLEQAGCSTVVARDGYGALDIAARVTPDIILLDAVMPGIDGFETCRRLRERQAGADAPVIFMTGLGDPADVVRGLAAGGVDYVVKPVNHDVLLARITIHALNARRMRLAAGALDRAGRPVFAARADGEVVWATHEAARLLADDACGQGERRRLQGAPLAWLATVAGRPVSEAPALRHRDRRFTCLGRGGGGEIIVQVEVEHEGDAVARLQSRFGLTVREAETLLWLTAGKTNQEIAEILGMSRRTVDKHLEQVLVKLGVDNRTAAALTADRFLDHARQPA
ncbi:response regulator [Camelimonas abortus]|uniref:Response regulator n=1 Tax=Camelimonas abortus TaxID=1017184 RepID=A0ABV7LB81_9HYPH